MGEVAQTCEGRKSVGKTEKKAHLVWSPGFGKRLGLWLVGLGAVMGLAAHVPAAVAAYHEATAVVEVMLLRLSSRFALWSVLGLLSSACCAIQIILNAFSVGCAGFNTYLGPLRPFFMAVTILLQGFAWRMHLDPHSQSRVALGAAGSALTLALTFLPEALALVTAWRSRRVYGGAGAPSSMRVRIDFDLGNSMGCASCVESIQRTLLAQPGVTQAKAMLETGLAVCFLDPTSVASGDAPAFPSDPRAADPGGRAQELSEVLASAGFANCVNAVSNETFETAPRRGLGAALGVRGGGNDGGCSADASAGCDGGECHGGEYDGGECHGGGCHGPDSQSGAATASLSRPSSWHGYGMSLGLGLASSSCCAIQLGANVLASLNLVHLGCAGFNKVLGPPRAALRAVALAWLAFLWVSELRPRTFRSRTTSRSQSRRPGNDLRCLGRRTALCLALMYLPEMLRASRSTLGLPALSPATAGARVFEYTVEGMGCEACEAHVRSVIEGSSGVVAADVDFARGTARVLAAEDWDFEPDRIRAVLQRDHFDLQTTAPADPREVLQHPVEVKVQNRFGSSEEGEVKVAETP